MNTILFVCLLISPNLKVDLIKIAGQTKQEVEKEFGKPTKVELFKPNPETKCFCEKVYYLDGNVSIIYYQGKADWIRVKANVKLLNLNSPNVKAFHKDTDYSLIRASLITKENRCCELNG
jgi:hypothetical protein